MRTTRVPWSYRCRFSWGVPAGSDAQGDTIYKNRACQRPKDHEGDHISPEGDTCINDSPKPTKIKKRKERYESMGS